MIKTVTFHHNHTEFAFEIYRESPNVLCAIHVVSALGYHVLGCNLMMLRSTKSWIFYEGISVRKTGIIVKLVDSEPRPVDLRKKKK